MPTQFTAWSPTRLADYEQCPLLAKLKHLDKLCPRCFKGHVMGGFDRPAVCDACGEIIKKAPALERGSEIGASLERYVNGKGRHLHEEIKHPIVIKKAKELRTAFRRRRVQVELSVAFDRTWKMVRGWSPTAWLRAKLDVAYFPDSKSLNVIDWKTGNIDKQTGNVKASPEKYADQLEIYSVAGLTAFPGVEVVNSELIFVDCGARFNPVVTHDSLPRKEQEKEQAKWERRTLPMFRDDTFAPRANYGCRYCDFRKERGGPCKY